MQRLSGRRYISSFQSHNLLHDIQRLLFYSTSSSSSTDTEATHSFINYLVDSLNFSHQQALSASIKLSQQRQVNDFNFEANVNSVVTFFRKHEFDDTHIRKIVSSLPRLLCSDVEKTISPKLKKFQEQGFSGSDIVRVISVNPKICLMSESSIVPAVQILRQVLVSDTLVIAAMQKIRWITFTGVIKSLLPNVALLSSYGVPIESIRKHLLKQPLSFLQKPEIFKDVTIRVEKKLGIMRDAPMFLYGIHLLSGYSEETIESKYGMFKSFGWTQSGVQTFIMKNASCFTISVESIKKKLDFLMNELGLEPAYLTTHTSLFTCSLEKRVVPRHKVLLILKEKGLMTKYPSLDKVVRMPEPCFLKRFVLPFKEAHEVYAKHTGCSMKMLTQLDADNLL